ncbi:MAG: hypothetical protein DLM61_27715 [Pseudonocardiales bacterium]|nr:MAG: hypothetical protein DLM61_27715 [Pseudonocardiales bacterium]
MLFTMSFSHYKFDDFVFLLHAQNNSPKGLSYSGTLHSTCAQNSCLGEPVVVFVERVLVRIREFKQVRTGSGRVEAGLKEITTERLFAQIFNFL